MTVVDGEVADAVGVMYTGRRRMLMSATGHRLEGEVAMVRELNIEGEVLDYEKVLAVKLGEEVKKALERLDADDSIIVGITTIELAGFIPDTTTGRLRKSRSSLLNLSHHVNCTHESTITDGRGGLCGSLERRRDLLSCHASLWGGKLIGYYMYMPLVIEMEFVKALDRQGRLVLPKEWRERYAKRGLVLVRVEGARVVVEPLELPDLTQFFDSIEVDLKAELTDWKAVKGELLEVR
jgi:bifunctional DNA-binding transcriptional regulator/antitoxin component of YhaV-PrlF toxin-antitoxin module